MPSAVGEKPSNPLRRSPRFHHSNGGGATVSSASKRRNRRNANRISTKEDEEGSKRSSTRSGKLYGRKTSVKFLDDSPIKEKTRISAPRIGLVNKKQNENEGDSAVKESQHRRRSARLAGIKYNLSEETETPDLKKERRSGVSVVHDERTTQVREETLHGWSEEQEVALRNAYFTAKPTPHFWKKVARMVPGKSAEECFNRIHSDLSTPHQQRTMMMMMRPRGRGRKPVSDLSLSPAKLLNPADKKKKRRRNNTLEAQKMVRRLLEKQKKDDQHYEADLFDVLEPTPDPIPFNFKDDDIALGKVSTSPSSHKRPRSRYVDTQQVEFFSPPVLKQIKNKALHESYIDQLHQRDAKRKLESLKNAKRNEKQMNNDLKVVNSVKVARNALVSDAQAVLSQIQTSTSHITEIDSDDDHTSCPEEEEDESDSMHS